MIQLLEILMEYKIYFKLTNNHWIQVQSILKMTAALLLSKLQLAPSPGSTVLVH